MKTRIGVYGSLLSGLGNHGTLAQHKDKEGAVTFVGTDRIKGFDLYAVYSFPGIKRNPSTDKTVEVEVYDVDESALASVRALEGYNPNRSNNHFYDEILADTVSGDKISVYLYMPGVAQDKHVPDGNWRAFESNMSF